MNKESTKKIGLWNIVGLGVGGAVGSGIFVTLGSAIAKTGRSILPITIICVFYMLLAYWYNLAMSGVFIIEGGDYSMKGMLLPPLLTGYGGWSNVIWAFGFTGYALSLTSYLSSLWPALAEHRQLSSAILLTLFFLLTIKGNRVVTLFQNIATILLVGALVLFVVVGFSHVNIENFFSALMMVASVTVALQASSAPLLLWAGPARARLWGLWVWCLLPRTPSERSPWVLLLPAWWFLWSTA